MLAGGRAVGGLRDWGGGGGRALSFLGATRRDGKDDESGDGRGARARSRSLRAGAARLGSASAAHTRRGQTGGRPAAAPLGAGGVYAAAATT